MTQQEIYETPNREIAWYLPLLVLMLLFFYLSLASWFLFPSLKMELILMFNPILTGILTYLIFKK